MSRLALALALTAMLAACLPAPGLYLALGLGIGAIGTGWVAYSQRTAPGPRRLAAAAAITVGVLGVLLGSARVVITLIAIDRIDRMIG